MSAVKMSPYRKIRHELGVYQEVIKLLTEGQLEELLGVADGEVRAVIERRLIGKRIEADLAKGGE